MTAETSILFKVETKDAKTKVASLEEQVKKLEIAVRKTGGTTVKSGAGFKAFSGGAQAAAVGARGLGAALSTALGPLTAVVAAAASLGQVFGVLRQQDFAEAKVRSLGVNSQELTARLASVSTELSGQASVLDLTGAAYDVASAGFNNAADAALILKAASQGATGGFSDINTVGDATTSVLNAYGLEANKAAQLVDGFIQTQNDGKIVIGQYAANIAKVAPVAAALGVPLEEINAAVAQITAGGQGAEVTFTALKTAFASVAAGKVGKEFSALGVEINASTLKSDGLAGTLEKIKKSGADAGTVIKAFGTEAGPSILALLNDTEKYNQLLEKQKEAQGAAAKAAFTASDTIDGQLKRLTTAFQNLFSDQSELGVLIKETFKVAAVTVEVLAAAINLTIAPIRALFAAANEVGKAISQALGVDGTNAAFQLEQGFQSIMKTIKQVQNFIVGFGVKVGKAMGKVYALIINGSKSVASNVSGTFASMFESVTNFIRKAYALIPKPIRDFLEERAGKIASLGQTLAANASSFFADTAALGAGFGPGSGIDPATSSQDQANAITATNGALSKQIKKEKEIADKKAKQLEKSKELKFQADKQFAVLIETDEREKIRIASMFKLSEVSQKYSNLLANQKSEQEESNLLIARSLELGKVRIDQAKALEEIQNKEVKDEADKFSKFFAQAAEVDKELFDKGSKLRELYGSIGESISTGIVDSLTAAVDGTKSLAEVASDTLKNIANTLLQFGVNSLLGGLGSGGGFLGTLFGGFKADGGTVTGGKSYIVGESGPELFSPGRSGSIAPNGALGGGANVVVNVDASGSSAQADGQRAKKLGSAIGAAVQAELVKQKRPGGLLAG